MRFNILPTLFALLFLSATSQASLQNATSLVLDNKPGGGGGGGGRGNPKPKYPGSSGAGGLVPELPEPPPSENIPEPAGDDDTKFSLGTYANKGGQALFHNFEEPADVYFFAELYTFFATEPSDESAYDGVTGNDQTYEQPFESGQGPWAKNQLPLTPGQRLSFERTYEDPNTPGDVQIVTSTFNPDDSADLCGAWSSLAAYCSGAETDCACHSGSYYVPEMWNSLAAGCAAYNTDDSACDVDDYTCQLASEAQLNTLYCPTDVEDQLVFKFGAQPNTYVPAQATDGSSDDDEPAQTTDTSSPSPTSTPDSAEPPSTTSTPETQTPPPQTTSITTMPYAASTSFYHTDPTPTSSASRSFSRKTAGHGPWMILIALSLYGTIWV